MKSVDGLSKRMQRTSGLPQALLLLLLLLATSACTSLPDNPDARPTHRCNDSFHLSNDFYREASQGKLPPSRFLAVDTSREALEWRLAMIDQSRKTLDIQYFLWYMDDLGKLFLQHVLEAADRGVKVRLLLDDLETAGITREARLLLSHPNIQVRIYNPFVMRDSGWFGRSIELLSTLPRLTHRMHNKVILMDGSVAIVGGRNISGEYFGMASVHDYRDFDLLAMGPVLQGVKNSIEVIWNSEWAFDARRFYIPFATDAEYRQVREELQNHIRKMENIAKIYRLSPAQWLQRLDEVRDRIISAPGITIYDCPPPVVYRPRVSQSSDALKKILQHAQKEVIIVSPYVVPLKKHNKWLREMKKRKVKIRFLTNSLASNDAMYAAGGYNLLRKDILAMGVELHELKPHAEIWKESRIKYSRATYLSLHAKIIIVDQRWVYVGSVNFDPRSTGLNTELGFLVDSKALAGDIYGIIKDEFEPQNSWRVELYTPGPDEWDDPDWEYVESRKLRWVAGKEVLEEEPALNMIQRLKQSVFTGIYSVTPIPEQL